MSQRKTVFVVGGDPMVAKMFRSFGIATAFDIANADMVCFTGGADVSPQLYGEDKHPSTSCSPERDRREGEIYIQCRKLNKPMVGICRGGQFLNVMNGGKMYQDVDNHAVAAGHVLVDLETSERIKVTSTHHQMMRPNLATDAECEVVAIAHLTTRREMARIVTYKHNMNGLWEDYEVLWYSKTKCLCFQPHPEYSFKSCTDYFYRLLIRFGFIEVLDLKPSIEAA